MRMRKLERRFEQFSSDRGYSSCYVRDVERGLSAKPHSGLDRFRRLCLSRVIVDVMVVLI